MKNTKRARLEAHGWRVGSVAEFLELTPEEAAFVETKLALSRCVRDRRTAQKVSQSDLAKRLKSSQSRVAKMEAGDPSVSLDLLVRTLLATGTSGADIASAFTTGAPGTGKARKSA